MMKDIINNNIKDAWTLPSEYYTDESIFVKIKAIINEMWHFSAHESQLSEYKIIPINHSEGMMGESIILTRDGVINALSNVCTHRGMIINENSSNKNVLKCGYHGRTFDLKGRMKNMPEFEGISNFPDSSDDLVKFSIERWNGILFTSIKKKEAPTWIKELEERLSWMSIENFKYDPTYHRSYDIKANWALYVDNYLEGFHIPYVHSDLHNVLDYEGYETELFEGGVLQIGIAKDGELSFDLPPESKDYGKKIAAYYYWIFPGLMMNFYPWGLSVNLVIPISVNSTQIVYQRYVSNEDMIGKGAGGDLDKVEQEDQGIVEAVQRGVSSLSYHRGRYSATMEKGVHHFHKMLTRI